MFEIGATLREARERRQLSYDQVEAETKIRAKYLRALEEEEFDALPSGTYVRGFLRAYASYLGLDGRLFVDEYASRFGTRHDDELFRRRRERPMTQRRESSSAVLVALIAVVAIGVLFFVAWRFGPGEADTPTPPFTVTADGTTPTRRATQRLDRARRTPTTTATTTHAPGITTQRSPSRCASTSADGGPTWVKITAPLDAPRRSPRRTSRRAGTSAAARSPTTTASRSRPPIPGNVSLAVNGHMFTLDGKGPWLVTADADGPHVVPAQDPAGPGDRGRSDGRQADGRAARDRAGAPARPRRGRQHALPRARARRARHRAAPRRIVGDGARRDRRRPARARGPRPRRSPPAASGRRTTTARSRRSPRSAGAELALDEPLLRADRGDHGRVRAPARHRSGAQPRGRPQAGARAATARP